MAVRKRDLYKKWIRAAYNFIALIPSCSVRQVFSNFFSVSKFRNRKLKESRCLVFSPSTKREIIHFHVKVMQWRQRDVHKIATQVRINLLLKVLVSFTRPQLLFNHLCVSVITNLCFIPV